MCNDEGTWGSRAKRRKLTNTERGEDMIFLTTEESRVRTLGERNKGRLQSTTRREGSQKGEPPEESAGEALMRRGLH